MNNFLRTFRAVIATPFRALIFLYQKTLSPDHGWLRHFYPYGFCRHEPTCSEYALIELRERWLPVALWKITVRVASCHPWKKMSDEKIRSILKNGR